MKRFISALFAALILLNSSVTYATTDMYCEYFEANTHKFLSNSDIYPPNKIRELMIDMKVDNTYRLLYMRENEYIMQNGTAMVKFRNVFSRLDGKIEYNSETKITKAYLPESYVFFYNYTPEGIEEWRYYTPIKSIAIQPGRNRIDYSDYDGQHSITTTVTPNIVNGSLYVSAVDIGKIMGCLTTNEGAAYLYNNNVYMSLYQITG